MLWNLYPDWVLPQGSDEWLAWRNRVEFTASGDRIKVVAGDPSHYDNDSPKSWVDLKNGVASKWTEEAERATAYGRRHEDKALKAFNDMAQSGLQYEPVCIETEIGGHIVGASLDGYTWDEEKQLHRFVEIKCPYKQKRSSTWTKARDGKVPEWYLWQCSMQMACLMQNGHDAIGVFYVFIPPGRGGPDFQAVQLTHEQLGPRIDHLIDRIPRYLRGEDEPDKWFLTDAGQKEMRSRGLHNL